MLFSFPGARKPPLVSPNVSRSMSRPALLVRFTLWLWFAAAVAAGYFLVLQRIAASALPVVILGLAAGVLYAYFRVSPLRDWVDALDPRALVQIHLTRFVGVYFLYLFNRGDLPAAFAVPGGTGEIVVALGALGLIVLPLEAARLRSFLTIWNVVGLFEIVSVVLTIMRLNLADPTQLRALTHLPLCLVPLFFLPLAAASHITIFARLLRR